MLPQQASLRRLTQRGNQENELTCTGLHCLPICEVAIGIAYTLGECNALLMCSVLHETPIFISASLLFLQRANKGCPPVSHRNRLLPIRASPVRDILGQSVTSRPSSVSSSNRYLSRSWNRSKPSPCRCHPRWQLRKGAFRTSSQRIWSKKIIGSVKGFAPMRM